VIQDSDPDPQMDPDIRTNKDLGQSQNVGLLDVPSCKNRPITVREMIQIVVKRPTSQR